MNTCGNKNKNNNTDNKSYNRYAVISLSCVTLFSGILLWAGCGTPEQKYKFWSFWIDGIPDPNAVIIDPVTGKSVPVSATIYQHKPYKDGDCSECHTSFSSIYISNKNSNICLKCHEDKVNEYPKMHGPVATVACLWCHHPHETTNPYMLRYPSPEVCIQCHERGKLLGDTPPEHLDTERDCLDCHVGHGSEKRYFLRANIPLSDQVSDKPQDNTEIIRNEDNNPPDTRQNVNPDELSPVDPTENVDDDQNTINKDNININNNNNSHAVEGI